MFFLYNEYKMSPTSISGGGNLLTGGELISPASLKGQEEVLPSAKLEQWPYNNFAVHLGRLTPQIATKPHGGLFFCTNKPFVYCIIK